MQVILNGTVSRLTLAVIGLGFSLVYLPTRTFHVALAIVARNIQIIGHVLQQKELERVQRLVA